MEKEKKSNIGLVIILSLLVLLLSGYVVYEKLISPERGKSISSIIFHNDSNQVSENDKPNSSNECETTQIDRFDDGLSYIISHYLPMLSMQIFKEDNTFQNDLSKINMSAFFTTYYPIYSNIYCRDYGTLCAKIEGARYSIQVSKSELDRITYILTGRKDYGDYESIIREQYGVIKKDDNTYEIAWYPTGFALNELSNTNLIMAGGTQAILDTTIVRNENGTPIDIGKVRFTFEYDNGDLYHLTKIEKK